MTADSILDKDMTQNPDDALLTELDAKRLRATFAQFPSGIVGICAEVEHDLVGMACSSFISQMVETQDARLRMLRLNADVFDSPGLSRSDVLAATDLLAILRYASDKVSSPR